MQLRRHGYPEEGEIVFCTVTKIQYHAVTVHLDEYDKQGLIPISEVSPGRIRNIREFVEEGKKVVCKVIKVDSDRAQIDVSLRRVNESQKRAKADSIKQEQKAEKILASLAEKLKKPFEEIYSQTAPKILAQYPYTYIAFDELVEKSEGLDKFGIDKALVRELEAIIKDKIKPKQVSIVEKVTIKTYHEDGLGLLKEAFAKAKEADPDLSVSYLGGGSYRMQITEKDFKKAEAILSNVEENMRKALLKKGTIEFSRQEA